MMIPFDYLVDKFKINAKGVLHIGSNTGQEAEAYKKHNIENVIWIEAIPEVYDKLLLHLDSLGCSGETVMCINACVGDVNGKKVVFHESNNESQSSSYLDLGVHAEIHPTVKYIRDIPMETYRIDTILSGVDMSYFDLLNIDIQGPELQALIGMGKMLAGFKYAIIEINMRETYRGGALVGEIDRYMELFDFVRAETGQWVAETWTDGFYIQKKLLENGL
jgi:FkbM family methyltransferase